MPSVRTFGGKKDMKSRAVLAFAENGLNLAVTSVMNLVNILGAAYAFPSVTTFCFSGAGGGGTQRGAKLHNFAQRGLQLGSLTGIE